MSPDLTDLQLISLGIAIAIATTFTTVLILTPRIRRGDSQTPATTGIPSRKKDPLKPTGAPPHFHPTMSSPTLSSNEQLSEPQTWHPLAQRPQPVPFTGEWSQFRLPPPDEYYSSQEELSPDHDTRELDGCHSPTPWPEDPGTLAWHIRAAEDAADPWGDAAPSNATNDPDYPTGSWEPGDRERAAAQNEQDAPSPFARDNVYIEDKHIDASPSYITRRALAAPRSRTGPHSPTYNRTDPFAALRRNYIPFSPTGRRYVPPVPFGQWPDESNTSDSSDESDWG